MKNPIRVLAVGCYGVANVGDELLLLTLHKWVQELGGEITVVSLDPDYTASSMKLPTVSFFDFAQIARIMENTDLLVMGGGGIFQDHYNFSINALYDSSSYEVSSFARPYYIAKQFGVPTLIWAHGIGPLKGDDAKAVVKDVFSTADFVSLRDEASAKTLRELGINRSVTVAADPTWALVSNPSFQSKPKESISLPNKKKKLGLILRSWGGDVDWITNLLGALRKVIKSDWVCVMIGFQTVRDDFISVSDGPFLLELSEKLGSDISTTIIDGLDPYEAKSIIEQCDAVLAMRLHGLILSLASGIPTVSYEYDAKIGLAAKAASMPDELRLSIDSDENSLIEALQNIMRVNEQSNVIPKNVIESQAASAIHHRQILQSAMISVSQHRRINNWKSGNYDWLSNWMVRDKYDMTNLLKKVANTDILQAERNVAIAERDAILERLNRITDSTSWRVTRPFRFALRLLRYGVTNKDRQQIFHSLRHRYHHLPLPIKFKNLARFIYHRIFLNVVPLIRNFIRFTDFKAPSIKPIPNLQRNYDYFVWGVIDWHFRHQRPQQLALALAASGRRVLYISPNLVDDGRAGFEAESLDATGHLFQIKLFAKGAPTIYSDAPSLDIVEQLRRSIGEVMNWGSCQKNVSLVNHPFWLDIASVLPNTRLVYDCMDHHEGFGNNSVPLLQLEKRLLNDAELTISTSTWLDAAIAPYAKRRALIRNAGDYQHFAKEPDSVYRDPQGRRVIGYYGAIAEWFDLDLVEAVAKQHPNCCVLLIGADTVNARTRLAKLPNVKFTGEVPYSQLPHYLHGMDVCLLPFKVIPLTLATNPVKAYEYLGAGKPVVTVDLPEMAQFEGLVYAAECKDAFLAAVSKVLSQTEPDDLVQKRKTFAHGQTWQHRAEALVQVVESSAHDPKVSVVVLTYNNLNFTHECLSSLDMHSQYANLEIIVVDNASSDGTPAFLSEWVANGDNRRLILNDENRGFAAANNQGLAVATGEYLVILNNDTYVTPGWLRTLLRHLQRDESIGLIGPVTNNIGNEAKINIAYSNMDEMLVKSSAYTHRHIGQTYPIRTAAFFCVMLPRSTYERVGRLDEAFGRGFFEDDDYCRRIEQVGLRVACAEDVFIHHHLSASFDKLKQQDRLKLFEDNKKIYEAKWGQWVPHGLRSHSSHPAPAQQQSEHVPEAFGGQKYITGNCVVCGNSSRFFYQDVALWRESLNCQYCRSTSRYRSIARGLLRAITELTGVQASSLATLQRSSNRKLRVYDTQTPFYYDPCAYPLPDLLKATGWVDVELSNYKPNKPMGAVLGKGITNQNLECLTFADESLDIVITSDVMEHVRLDNLAHREIYRVLKPGGIYLFTVPHDRTWDKTLIRVQVIDPADQSKDAHLLEPEYHGDTNSDGGGGVLAYRTYGRDIETQLSDLGFEVAYFKEDLADLGILNTELYYCRKSAIPPEPTFVSEYL